jgi:uncharacterized membrane protein YfcA
LALGGLPGVLIAALIVKSLPLTAMRWLVIVAVVYAAFTMLRSAMQGRASASASLSSQADTGQAEAARQAEAKLY